MTCDRPREDLRLLSAAHVAALSARCGTLDRGQLLALRHRVAGRPKEDLLRGMVEGFADGADAVLRDKAALAAQGEALQRDVLRQLMPGPVDAGRADIHG